MLIRLPNDVISITVSTHHVQPPVHIKWCQHEIPSWTKLLTATWNNGFNQRVRYLKLYKILRNICTWNGQILPYINWGKMTIPTCQLWYLHDFHLGLSHLGMYMTTRWSWNKKKYRNYTTKNVWSKGGRLIKYMLERTVIYFP